MKPALRSVAAVGGAFLAVAIVTTITDVVLESTGVFPPPSKGLFIPWMLALAILYRTFYAVAGGWLAARFAPRAPLAHAVVLTLIGIVVSILGTLANLDKSPRWYPIVLIVLSVPAILGGARLEMRKDAPRGGMEEAAA